MAAWRLPHYCRAFPEVYAKRQSESSRFLKKAVQKTFGAGLDKG
jgi:hypothetical protein